MCFEGDLIISILKLAVNRPVAHELINRDAKIPAHAALKLLAKLQADGLIYVQKGAVEADNVQRLELALYAISLGVDVERASSYLQWQEFESIAAFALEQNQYSTSRNLRFKHRGRRWEIDVVGCKKPLVICIDCKHWRHGLHGSALRRVAQEQIKRIDALADSLPDPAIRIDCASWDKITFVPAITSLTASSPRFSDGVPVVPILQMHDFLDQLFGCLDQVKRRTVRLCDRLR